MAPPSPVPSAVEPVTPDRLALQQRFWTEHGIRLATEVDAVWKPLGEPVLVSLVIQNHGTRVMTLPMRRRPDIFDDPTEERGQVYLEVSEVHWSARWGRRTSHRRERVSAPEQLEIPPGNELRLQFQVTVPVSEDTDLLTLKVQGLLYPLAVRFPEEPDRFIAMTFPLRQMHCTAAEVVDQWGIGDWTRLEGDSLEDPAHVLGLAVMFAELDRIRVTDWLVAGLPGPNTLSRSALLMALEEVTGQRLGPSVSRWRSWWESERGVQWSLAERRRQSIREEGR